MGFLLELLVFGTFWFYAVCILASVGMIILLELNRYLTASGIFLLTMLALIFMGNWGILPWLANHPYHACIGAVAYLGIAVVWGVIRWLLIVRDLREYVDSQKRKWIQGLQEKLDKNRVSDEKKQSYQDTIASGTLVGVAETEWIEYVESRERTRREAMRNSYRPDPIPRSIKRPTTRQEVIALLEENKSRIIWGMTYCPWDMAWTILNDPIRKLMKRLFNSMRSTLVWIGMKTFKIPA